jgi:tetratricopeptide (TPR) repeat protein
MLVSRPVLGSNNRWSAYFCVLLALSESASARSNAPEAETTAGPSVAEALDPTVALIRDLGAADYASRERAQGKLRRMGLEVFDQLYDAQTSDDIEIALRARYLLHSLTIRWSQDDDPLPVKELLRAYGDSSEDERRSLIEQLAKLPESQGVKAICRVVRFETSNVLSKRAALLIMQRKTVSASPPLESQSDVIAETLGTSRREAASWLRVYAATLKNPAGTLQDWERISAQEEQAFQNTPDRSAPDIVRDLFRWRADLLERVGRKAESLAVILKTIDLLDGTRRQLVDAVNWLLERRAWSTIVDVSKRFPERFQESTLLSYRLAEAQSQSGQLEAAEKTSQQALKSNQDNQQEHLEAAFSLQERGLFEWSEREYRQVLERVPPGAPEGFQARLLFSEMLHDLLREQDAATALRDIVESSEKDENIRYMIARFRNQPGSVASRMYFFLAEHARASGDEKQQIEHLKKAVQFDPTDADVLIGMYRASHSDPSWRKETLELISNAVKAFREEVRDCEVQAAEAQTEGVREDIHRDLASAHNQLAWLVANTVGDYDEALRSSQRSLELRPETAGYLDTLGQCYYAKGDYKNAVVHQSRAAELDPHSRQISRQLEFFRRAAEK